MIVRLLSWFHLLQWFDLYVPQIINWVFTLCKIFIFQINLSVFNLTYIWRCLSYEIYTLFKKVTIKRIRKHGINGILQPNFHFKLWNIIIFLQVESIFLKKEIKRKKWSLNDTWYSLDICCLLKSHAEM